MTLLEFIDFWTGKPVMDFDGRYGNQCVDLFRFYLRDCLQVAQPPGVRGAKDLATNYNPKDFDWINNDPFAVPQAGDIIIFDASPGNSFGHVSVFVEGDINQFTSFDINYPSQGYVDKNGNFIGTGTAHLQKHKYTYVLGWLRPTKTPQGGGTMANYYPTSEPHIDLNNPAAVKVAVDQWVRVLKGDLIDKKAHDTMIAEIRKLAEEDKKAAVERAKIEGIEIGKAQATPPESNSGNSGEIDLSGWEVNGLTVEKQVGDTKIVQNYKRKA